ncbi:MAG: T9SS type A sorting domain-containing protein, partial [Ignavibacteriae bacterium]|nr:T9SS type A sorting domain-containing protein [Ignavibacteriota bacterium]
GQNEFRFITMNAGKNSFDTAKYSVTVSNELLVKDLYNYPNPMKTETTFTFNLAGSNIPTDCRIKIFSVAGRVVKTLKIPAGIGFNQYAWDGRDEEGDYMANGVYFYKVIIEGDNQKETALQKLAILR